MNHKVHYCVHEIPPLDHIVNQINPVDTLILLYYDYSPFVGP
jgi:hypothetical protein